MSEHLIQAEFNTMQWAHMTFLPSHTARIQRGPRTLRWTVVDSQSCATNKAEITIHPTRIGEALTTFDLRTWLTLQYLWWNSPGRKPHHPIPVTLGVIGRTMRHAKAEPSRGVLERSLARLSEVRLEWRDSFRIPSPLHKHGRIEKGTVSFTLLENVESNAMPDKADHEPRTDQRSTGNRLDRSRNIGYRFNKRIEINLEHHVTQFIDFMTAVRLRSELGISVYVLLNGILTNRPKWQRDVWKLLYEDLCFPTPYHTDAALRKILRNPMKELQGKPLVQGCLHLALKTDTREESAASILECNGEGSAMTPKLVVTR